MDSPPDIPSTPTETPPPVPKNQVPPVIPDVPVKSPRNGSSSTILAIIAVVVILFIGGMGALGYIAYRKVKAAIPANKTVMAAKMIVGMNSDLELVSADDAKGTVTIRIKSSGETMTLDLGALEKGDFGKLGAGVATEESSQTKEEAAAAGTSSPLPSTPPISKTSKEIIAAAQMLTAMQPNLEMVRADDNELVMRDKQTGETVTIDLKELQAGHLDRAIKNNPFASPPAVATPNPETAAATDAAPLVAAIPEAATTPEVVTSAIEKNLEAAEIGDREAQYQAALSLMQGSGIPKNPEQATIWLRRASDQGHPKAQQKLGEFYASGESKDLVEAYKWLSIASTHGEDNKVLLKQVHSEMSAEQLTDAQQRVSSFQEVIEAD